MNDDQWATFSMLLDKGFKWRDPFGPAHEFTYRTLLDGHDPEQVATALRALVAKGQTFGPTPGEIVAQIRADPSKPTFEEAYRLIYGSGGVLRARAPVGAYPDAATMARAQQAARRERAAGLHPLLALFVDRYGLDRLEALEVDHPDYGDLKRKELREAWSRHVDAFEGREVAALASGRRGEIGRFDPLAALGPPRKELAERTSA